MKVKNRKCIWKLSWRFLCASHKRNIVAIVDIVLTTLMFTSLFTIVMSLNSSYETYTFRQIGGYSHGTFKEVTDEQIQAISGHSKVKETGVRINIGFMDSGVFAKSPAEISFMDENCTKWSYANPIAGHSPEKAKEIAMDTRTLKLLGIEPKLGAEITLTYTVGDKKQISFDKTDTFILSGWWEYDDISPVHYINVSREYAKLIEAEGMSAGMHRFRTDLNVMMVSQLNIRGQMEQVDLDLGYTWEGKQDNTVRIGVNWGYTTAQLAESMDITTMIGIISFLMLVIFTGYLIIYNIFQISVTGDIRFYGLLKTIGVTPRQLKCIIRCQALFLCVAGIPVGLLTGYTVGAVLTPVVMASTTLGNGITTISNSPLIFLLSSVFALITVLFSCSRPGKIASRVSPVEATKYTETVQTKKKHRSTRGAKIYQMAFANLGRNKSKTMLVVVSLSLSVVLLNVLVSFTNGFDMEKYLAKQTCADFIVSKTGYFRFASGAESYISQDFINQIEENTTHELSGCGYTLNGVKPLCWMKEDIWREDRSYFYSDEEIETALNYSSRRGELIGETAQIEGLDKALFEKLDVVQGDISPMLEGETNNIAVEVYTDDYGNVSDLNFYPPLGSIQTITYIDEAYYIDSRTGEKCDENTPVEFLKYHIAKSHDADYTVCAYVEVPYSMGYRYTTTGYNFVLTKEKMKADSGLEPVSLYYLFDTPNIESEEMAEKYLADLTAAESSGLMYESKATVRKEFESFQNMFLLLGGLLCAIIALVGILNFVNAIMTGINSRKREFAILQSVGMTNKQLKTMLIYEGLFYAFSSVLVAFILSLTLNPIIGKLFENMFWFFSAGFTIIPVLAVTPIFALIGYLIPAVMYGHTVKYSIVERLREV